MLREKLSVVVHGLSHGRAHQRERDIVHVRGVVEMAYTHRVEQGDCVASIAAQNGISDWQAIWNHPQNKAIRELRSDPFVLRPGDRLYVPDSDRFTANAATGQRHRFVAQPLTIPYKLKFQSRDGQAFADKRYVLEVLSRRFEGRTGSQGEIEHEIPATATRGVLTLWLDGDEHASAIGMTYQLHIGHLDPVEEIEGVQARLHNLGYGCPSSGQLDDGTRKALRTFQKTEKLEVTGEIDDATRDALLRKHKGEG